MLAHPLTWSAAIISALDIGTDTGLTTSLDRIAKRLSVYAARLFSLCD